MSTDESCLRRERVLLVDDTPANLDLLTRTLEPDGYDLIVATSGEAALRLVSRGVPDLILLDVMMRGIDGLETCRRLKADAASREVPVLFISARDQGDVLVEGFQAGAIDYITKPFDPAEVRVRVSTHLRLARLTRELWDRNAELEEINARLTRETGRRKRAEEALDTADQRLSLLNGRESRRWGLPTFIGKSRTLRGILESVRKVQNFTTVNVLIGGESGTGKELVARALHFGGARPDAPFIPVNCVAIPQELAESTLFGHAKGAFTGALLDHKGLFELADGGTLFLDEIADMPLPVQAKLLRVLEDGRITPLGSQKPKQVRVRIIAAANVDLWAKVQKGEFRQDLYFRLAGFTVTVPPLRDRPEDIPLLAKHFLSILADEMGVDAPALSQEALDTLAGYAFPGNVRELKNMIERALIECDAGDRVTADHLNLPRTVPARQAVSRITAVAADAEDLPINLDAAEDALIRRALAVTNGNVTEAARRLGINRTRIYRRMSETSAEKSE